MMPSSSTPQRPLSLEACLFCKIARGDIPAQRIYETEQVVVFQDIQPQAPVHWLATHRHHTNSHLDTDQPCLLADLMEALRQAAIRQGIQHYRLIINNGAEAGQSVFHLHVHLLAGRPLQWPPG